MWLFVLLQAVNSFKVELVKICCPRVSMQLITLHVKMRAQDYAPGEMTHHKIVFVSENRAPFAWYRKWKQARGDSQDSGSVP